MSKIKIALLAGGISAEKEISRRSGENLYKALTNSGFETTILNPADSEFSIDSLKNYDAVYPILHGTNGEDGVIQGVLEYLNIPFVGCGVTASAVTMNKEFTKDIFQSIGIPSPQGFTASSNLQDNLEKIQNIGYPVFVKPASEGSSVGGLLLHNAEEAKEKLEAHLQQFPHSLVEQFIVGREMTLGMIQKNSEIIILPILELKPKAEFYNFETKYTAGMTEFILPAPIEESILNKIQNDVIKIFNHFQLRDCIRVDFFLTEKGPVYLEINTAPGMTETSDIPAMLNSAGILIEDFVATMIYNALERKNSG